MLLELLEEVDLKFNWINSKEVYVFMVVVEFIQGSSWFLKILRYILIDIYCVEDFYGEI